MSLCDKILFFSAIKYFFFVNDMDYFACDVREVERKCDDTFKLNIEIVRGYFY